VLAADLVAEVSCVLLLFLQPLRNTSGRKQQTSLRSIFIECSPISRLKSYTIFGAWETEGLLQVESPMAPQAAVQWIEIDRRIELIQMFSAGAKGEISIDKKRR
jgi:hypothetical protein